MPEKKLTEWPKLVFSNSLGCVLEFNEKSFYVDIPRHIAPKIRRPNTFLQVKQEAIDYLNEADEKWQKMLATNKKIKGFKSTYWKR